MARLQLIELEDQKWFPSRIRDCMTDILNLQITLFQIYDPIVSILHQTLIKAKTREILDLCSGGAGAIHRVLRLLSSKMNFEALVKLSDVYPNNNAIDRISALKDESIHYIKKPIDAMKVPGNLKGLRTLFTSFHHFNENAGKNILADAVKNRRAIAIFELSERSIVGVLLAFSSFLVVPLLTPFIRPFCLKRFFFTYVIPLIPFAYVFDGVVSQLRSYTPKELLRMAQAVDDTSYHWESGHVLHHFLPIRITYLVGYEKEQE
jgi:hypothetical protein